MAFHDTKASYKAVVYFKDGNKRTFWSREFPYTGSKKRNVILGLTRLEKMLEGKFRGTYEAAVIYSRVPDIEYARYIDGYKALRTDRIKLAHPNYTKEKEGQNQKIEAYRQSMNNEMKQ